MRTDDLKSPFPYFGGKRAICKLLWERLGDVDNYIVPFAGSIPDILMRPDWHTGRIETVNDKDCFVANFWRATKYAPDQVAAHADWPVNEADLHARHQWLVYSDDARAFRRRMRSEPWYFDARIAGWWCWGMCQWIGSGWCRRPDWEGRGSALRGRGCGVNVQGQATPQQMLDLSGDCKAAGRSPRDNGHGVHRVPKRTPTAQSGLTGVHRRPQLGDAYSAGRGVHANDHAGTCEQRRAWLMDWFERLKDRLRNVRVCCGDWPRVCVSHSVTDRLGVTGIFFDPPYGAQTGRSINLYAEDSGTVAEDVRRYCLDRGANPKMRIALCGLRDEHDDLLEHGWTVEAWTAQGGYGNRGGQNEKRGDERIWFSPHCLRQPQAVQSSLFDSFIERSGAK